MISNIGASTAKNVRLRFDPELKTSLGERTRPLTQTPLIASGIPSLPPGRQFKTAFELLPGSGRPDLPKQYRVEVTYDGSFGPFEEAHTLDLQLLAETVNVRGTRPHPLAKVLKSINKNLDSIAGSLGSARSD